MMLIPLSQERFALIDDEDADLMASKWWTKKHGKTFYAQRTARRPDGSRTTERLHCVIASRMAIVGNPDHKNRCGLDNRRDNLREATHAQNSANRGVRSDNKSGFKGVSIDRAYIKLQGANRCLGRFADAASAARAYDAAAKEAFGEFAVLNFPELKPNPLREYWNAVDAYYRSVGMTDDDAHDDWRERVRKFKGGQR